MVLVIGATGKTGIHLVKLLEENGEHVRAATRNPSAFSLHAMGSTKAVKFDFDRPETFAPALVGVEKVFLMARPGDNYSDRVAIPFIDEAKKKRVRLIVDLTAMGVEQDAGFPLRILEKYIEASGIPFTHLRPNWFMQNFNSGSMLADIRSTGALHLPAADAKVSFIDIRDIAAVGCCVLRERRHEGMAYTLTGGEALDHHQVTSILSRVANRSISYVPIGEDIARTVLDKAGVPLDQIERWATFFQKMRQGLCARISDDVTTMLGRPAICFERYAEDHSSFWR